MVGGFVLNERIYSNKALRQITTLPGERGGGSRLCLSFYGVSVYGKGVSFKQKTLFSQGVTANNNTPGGIRDFVSRFTVRLCMVGGFF